MNLTTKTLVFKKKILEYVGLPLAITVCRGEKSFGGISNFLASNEKTKTNIDLKDLNDCFSWINQRSTRRNYIFGYIMDYSTKTIYYDKKEALDFVNDLELQEPDEKNFFKNFIQKDFSSHKATKGVAEVD